MFDPGSGWAGAPHKGLERLFSAHRDCLGFRSTSHPAGGSRTGHALPDEPVRWLA